MKKMLYYHKTLKITMKIQWLQSGYVMDAMIVELFYTNPRYVYLHEMS